MLGASGVQQLTENLGAIRTDRNRGVAGIQSREAEATRKRFYGDGKVPYTPPKASQKG